MNQVLFGVIAASGVLAALGTVLARNLVHAALFLVAFFFLVACQFVMLEAEFLAAVQVLVYIGAVAILLMFGIMLTRNIQGDETTRVGRPGLVAGGLASVGLLAVLVLAIHGEDGMIGRAPWRAMTSRPAIGPDPALRDTDRARTINDMGLKVGEEMLARYVVAFELAGLLLTAALVGAIALAVQDSSREDDDPSARVRDRPTSTLTRAGA